ncbi:MAG: hypothetical protein ACTH8F_04605, partial [Microbacterium sp.]|uniref:hypothetical protein n=1 Tax=Microbacterium sp. TaxID=51671 RepID=UPI003F9DCBF7
MAGADDPGIEAALVRVLCEACETCARVSVVVTAVSVWSAVVSAVTMLAGSVTVKVRLTVTLVAEVPWSAFRVPRAVAWVSESAS